MARDFTDEDRGTPIRTAEGERIGEIASVDRGTARVDPAADLRDETRRDFGWDPSTEGPYELRDEQIDTITDEEVRLRER
jgi:hypothetical protein